MLLQYSACIIILKAFDGFGGVHPACSDAVPLPDSSGERPTRWRLVGGNNDIPFSIWGNREKVFQNW